jgi:hypothetical protein
MNGFHVYSSQGSVEVGDVVRMMPGDEALPGHNPFDTSVVTDIRPNPQFPEVTMVHLARPHLQVHKIGSMKGTPYTALEQYEVQLHMFVARFEAYTTGHSGMVDNRRDD